MGLSKAALKNIYLADDDADDRLLFAEALKELDVDANLITAHDGRHLMLQLERDVPPQPAMIFLDLNMPLKNGAECLTEIKQIAKLRGTPVVIFSTSGHADSVDDIYEKGADFYICKPDNFQKLKAVLNKVFEIKFDGAYSRPARRDFVVKP